MLLYIMNESSLLLSNLELSSYGELLLLSDCEEFIVALEFFLSKVLYPPNIAPEGWLYSNLQEGYYIFLNKIFTEQHEMLFGHNTETLLKKWASENIFSCWDHYVDY